MRSRILVAALLATPCIVSAQSAADKQFLEKAAQGGMAEVELGKVAQQKATNPKVKEFASRMVTDHGKANDELKQVASRKGVTLPAGPSKDQQEHAKKLEAMNGTQFDQAYMKHMLDDHKKDVAEFEKQSKSATSFL